MYLLSNCIIFRLELLCLHSLPQTAIWKKVKEHTDPAISNLVTFAPICRSFKDILQKLKHNSSWFCRNNSISAPTLERKLYSVKCLHPVAPLDQESLEYLQHKHVHLLVGSNQILPSIKSYLSLSASCLQAVSVLCYLLWAVNIKFCAFSIR